MSNPFPKDSFDYWFDWMMRHPDLVISHDATRFYVTYDKGRKRISCWQLYQGDMRIYFEIKVEDSLVVVDNSYFAKGDWMEHRENGPSRITDKNEVRFTLYGKTVTERQLKDNYASIILKELEDEE